jgi:AraC family transcriptional regulator of adaptative response / DNA-3-methyladenine glycosylase II
MLDFDTCNAARLRRDPAYDGVFFTAVKTTGIYCRPVCPVKSPLTKNVTFYPSAAAAERGGYRPCLRCRPETAPFCPAWNDLAARLGIGARHLSRLFQRHLGASPTQTARTVRLHRAKRLLQDTDLQVTEIAYRAGFKSLRRFNAAFADLYNESPSEFRRRRLRPAGQEGKGGRAAA